MCAARLLRIKPRQEREARAHAQTQHLTLFEKQSSGSTLSISIRRFWPVLYFYLRKERHPHRPLPLNLPSAVVLIFVPCFTSHLPMLLRSYRSCTDATAVVGDLARHVQLAIPFSRPNPTHPLRGLDHSLVSALCRLSFICSKHLISTQSRLSVSSQRRIAQMRR